MTNPFQKFQFGSTDEAPASRLPHRRPERTPSHAVQRKRKHDASSNSVPKGLVEKLGSQPLRLVIIGHNPSHHAWNSGHYYSNPSNRMWSLLRETGIAPPEVRGAEDDDIMPERAGVGFTDVGFGDPGTISAEFTSKDFPRWAESLYRRLQQHTVEAANAIGCVRCTTGHAGSVCHSTATTPPHTGCRCGRCGAPCIVAFAGKRHYAELMKLPASKSWRQAPAAGLIAASPLVAMLQRATANAVGGTSPPTAPVTNTAESPPVHASRAAPDPEWSPRTSLPAPSSLLTAPCSQQQHGLRQVAAPDAGQMQPSPSAAAAAPPAAPAAAPPAAPAAAVAAAAGQQGACSTGRGKVAAIPLGRQAQVPQGWPLPPSTEVWVMTSTSGASALTNAARLAPWQQLQERLRDIPWPRGAAPLCLMR